MSPDTAPASVPPSSSPRKGAPRGASGGLRFFALCAAGWAAAGAAVVLLTDAPLGLLAEELARALP